MLSELAVDESMEIMVIRPVTAIQTVSHMRIHSARNRPHRELTREARGPEDRAWEPGLSPLCSAWPQTPGREQGLVLTPQQPLNPRG